MLGNFPRKILSEMASSQSSTSRRPILLTLAGLIAIASMVALPIFAGPPEGEKLPDMARFIGRFHPLILHLPIGIVSLALGLEIIRFFSKSRRGGAGSLVLGLAALSSIVAVILGFLLYQSDLDGGWDESALAESHMWNGIYFASAMVVTFLLKAWADTRGSDTSRLATLSRFGLFGSTVMMSVASHDGGSLTHGNDYLTKYAPTPVRKALKLPSSEKDAPGEEAVPIENQVVYTNFVAPILENRCVNCHSADKTKGKLRLDTHELILKGGKEGPAVVAGDLSKSHLVTRIELPKDDDEHMPPEDKPQVEEHELAVLKWWITNGADPAKTVAEMTPTPEVLAALTKLNGPVALATTGGAANHATQAAAPPVAPTGNPAGKMPDAALQAKVSDFSQEFPGALTFESQQSSSLAFTAVSLRQNLDDATFAKLKPVLPHLVTVDLSATKVTDNSVALLSEATELKMVRLSETGITDASIDSLLKLPKLESVNLFGTAVTDAGVQKLTALPNLKRLYLWQTQVTPQGVEELKQKMPGCEIVTGI